MTPSPEDVRRAYLEAASIDDDELRTQYLTQLAREQSELAAEVQALRGFDSKESVRGIPETFTGRQIGHYTLLERIGEGGMGSVYRAKHARLGREVALKVLQPWNMTSAKRKKCLAEEATSASKLSHENIVTIFDFGDASGVEYIVMELVLGKTLDEVIPPTGLPEFQALPILIQVNAAIAHAHKKGVTHGDLKPRNVMVTNDCKVKVLDFGLARVANQLGCSDISSDERTASFAGTPDYSSPEQIKDQTIDARSDVFSLGILFCRVLTGSRPFSRPTLAETVASIASEDEATLPAGLSEPMARIISRCLLKAPDQRYQSAGEVLAEMLRLNGNPPRTTWTRNMITAAILSVLLLVGFIILTGRQSVGADVDKSRTAVQDKSPIEALYNRGVEYMRAQKYDRAKAAFDDVIAQQPKYKDAVFDRGVCLQNLHRWSEALRDFNTVIQRDPKNWQALYDRATCHLNLEHTNEALNDYSSVIAIHPTKSAFLNRAKLRIRLGDEAGARNDENTAANMR